MKKHVDPIDLEMVAERNNKKGSELENLIEKVKKAMSPVHQRIFVTEDGTSRWYNVQRHGIGILKTEFGFFWEYSFFIDDIWGQYSVVVKAEIDPASLNPLFRKESLTIRTDSGCETGQLLRDLSCDCGEQLRMAMDIISQEGEGMIIHIPKQDGRGMGLPFKLATLWLQTELDVDTVEAAAILAPGGIIDIRTYSGVMCIVKFFGIPDNCNIKLATNNPDKANVFMENGYKVIDYKPVVAPPNEHTGKHLEAKQRKLGHVGLV